MVSGPVMASCLGGLMGKGGWRRPSGRAGSGRVGSEGEAADRADHGERGRFARRVGPSDLVRVYDDYLTWLEAQSWSRPA